MSFSLNGISVSSRRGNVVEGAVPALTRLRRRAAHMSAFVRHGLHLRRRRRRRRRRRLHPARRHVAQAGHLRLRARVHRAAGAVAGYACGRKRVIMGERVSSARMSKGKRFGWFRVKNLHTARPTVTLRCGTEATYPLRWRSRTPARRGPAGRRPARHPAVAGSKTRRRSRRRSREVRQIPRVIRPRFARDLISLLHSFRPGCRERRGRAGRVREMTRARRTCSSLDSSDDSLPSSHLLVPRQQRRLVAVRGQGRVVPRSAPREGHLAVLAARPFSDDEVAVFTAENLAPISSVGGPRAARDVDAHAFRAHFVYSVNRQRLYNP